MEVGLWEVCGFFEELVSKGDCEVVGLPFETKLVTDVHHPVDEDGPHEPVEISLSEFDVIGLYDILFLSVFESNYGLDFGSHVEFCFNRSELPQLLFVVDNRCWIMLIGPDLVLFFSQDLWDGFVTYWIGHQSGRTHC